MLQMLFVYQNRNVPVHVIADGPAMYSQKNPTVVFAWSSDGTLINLTHQLRQRAWLGERWTLLRWEKSTLRAITRKYISQNDYRFHVGRPFSGSRSRVFSRSWQISRRAGARTHRKNVVARTARHAMKNATFPRGDRTRHHFLYN
jgi:hypothetical protein